MLAPNGEHVKRTYPITLIVIGLLTMVGGACVVFAGSAFQGLWTVVAITIGVGFVTANFGRVALGPESQGEDMLRAAVCAVVHLSFSLMLVFFIGGMARAGGDAAGVAGLILPLSLVCVAVSLGRFGLIYRRELVRGGGNVVGPLL
jgi:hypothetical protein